LIKEELIITDLLLLANRGDVVLHIVELCLLLGQLLLQLCLVVLLVGKHILEPTACRFFDVLFHFLYLAFWDDGGA